MAVFQRLGRQWRRWQTLHGVRYECIPVEAIQAAVQLMGVKRKRQPELYAQLVVMERAALPVLNGD